MGNLAQVRAATSVGDVVDYDGANKLGAEVVPSVTATWHIIETVPAHELIAAGHLIGRRFGVYLPETEQVEIHRGRKVKMLRPLFPGYLFVFVWGLSRHFGRILACPGVWRFLQTGEQPAVISDELIDAIRAIENRERPLSVTVEVIGKPKKRWRRAKANFQEQFIHDNEIVGVRPWSAYLDGIAASANGHERNGLLHRAMGMTT
jgi:transcription antitermination factor NusG